MAGPPRMRPIVEGFFTIANPFDPSAERPSLEPIIPVSPKSLLIVGSNNEGINSIMQATSPPTSNLSSLDLEDTVPKAPRTIIPETEGPVMNVRAAKRVLWSGDPRRLSSQLSSSQTDGTSEPRHSSTQLLHPPSSFSGLSITIAQSSTSRTSSDPTIPSPSEDPYAIATDTPAAFPYQIHAYPIQSPGTYAEPTHTPLWTNYLREIYFPYATVVKNGGTERIFIADSNEEKQMSPPYRQLPPERATNTSHLRTQANFMEKDVGVWDHAGSRPGIDFKLQRVG
ncbi:MAG: hypothetical protein M1820_006796 [Bogoriella megaspora]|nr:MAG: hypothetical protein M1820_006796 [Bogoriella megaspora]